MPTIEFGIFVPVIVGLVLLWRTACRRRRRCGRPDGGQEALVSAWNIVGLLDLAVALTTGFLRSPSPLQLLSLQAPDELISAFPLVMIPVFAVPLAIVLHAASLIKLHRQTTSPLATAQAHG